MAIALCGAGQAFSQNDLSQLFPDSSMHPRHVPVTGTFKSSRLLLSNSNETIHKHDLVFYIEHRFDDIAGTNGGIKTFFGFDNTSDVNISFEYGITDRLTVGVGRCKGAPEIDISSVSGNPLYINSVTQLWGASLKYRLLEQTTDDHEPVSVTLFGDAVASTMAASTDTFSDAYFHSLNDRLSYTAQMIIARKFSERFSLALSPTYVRRNFVAFGDMNNLFALGAAARYKYNAHQSIIMQYFIPFRSAASIAYYANQGVQFHDPWGIGWEAETGGHVFQVLFTNATAIYENQFIPSTTRSWAKGQFRWGFNLSRTFVL